MIWRHYILPAGTPDLGGPISEIHCQIVEGRLYAYPHTPVVLRVQTEASVLANRCLCFALNLG